MDLLSLEVELTGALTAAIQTCSTLEAAKNKVKDVPRHVTTLLEEVRGTAEVLSSLQSLLFDKARRELSRTTLLRVESVLAIVTGCVSTFSQLQEVADYLRGDGSFVVDCTKWAAREVTLGAIVVRL